MSLFMGGWEKRGKVIEARKNREFFVNLRSCLGEGRWRSTQVPVDKMWNGSHESNQPIHYNYRL